MDPTELYQPRGVPDASIGFSVDTGSVAQRIVAALKEHRTQASDFDSLLSDDERLEAAARAHGIDRVAAMGAGRRCGDRRVRGPRLTERGAR